ncbi:MAG: GNAT family N-acetyltransferase [Streptosporangiaceae bacterium]
MGITIRPVRSGEDYAAWRQVLLTVEPGERAPTAGELRAQAGPQQRFSVAELDGMLAGSGAVGRSDLAGSAFVAPRVLPACRRQGVGSAILRLLAEQAAAMGFGVAGGIVEDPGSACFAERYGFREVDRQVQQVRVIGAEPVPQAPQGVIIVAVSAQPQLWRDAYESVGAQAFQDMATISALEVTLEQWERDWITDPDAMFVALADGEVIGCAGLAARSGPPTAGRACADRRAPGLAPARGCHRAQAQHTRLGGGPWVHRGLYLDPARQRRHAGAQYPPRFHHPLRMHHHAGDAAAPRLTAAQARQAGR